MTRSRSTTGRKAASNRAVGPRPREGKRPSPPPDPAALRRLGVTLAIVLGALLLRAWRVGHGLPDFLDEAIPLRRALDMTRWTTGAVDWNPRFFQYPTLTLYLHVLLQHTVYAAGRVAGAFAGYADYTLRSWADASWLAIPGRLLSVAFDLWTVWSTAAVAERVGRGAGPLAAGFAALCGTMILAARLIYTDTVMVAFAMAALERILAWEARGGRGRWLFAVVAIGLAAGSKYPGAVLLLPLAVAAWRRDARRAPAVVAASAAIAGAVFLCTTPFALAEPRLFLGDLAFVSRLGAGHLGSYEQRGFVHHAHTLMRDFGPAAWLLLAVSLVETVRTARRAPSLIPWVALVAIGGPMMTARVEAERYFVALAPLLAVLLAHGAFALAALAPVAWRRGAVIGAAALVLVPALRSGFLAAASQPDDTRIQARRWCEAHLDPESVLVQDAYGAPLLERWRQRPTHAGAVWRAASERARRAYDARPSHRVVTIPVSIVGTDYLPISLPGGGEEKVRVVDRGDRLNDPVFDPRLLAGVDVVITSASIRGRFEADSARYPAQRRYYALLDSAAEVAARFRGTRPGSGPDVTVYRLGPRFRRVLDALGPLPPLWWADVAMPSFRRRIEELWLVPAAERTVAPADAQGRPAAWVTSLGNLFANFYAPFARAIAIELFERGDAAHALPAARAVLTMRPDDRELASWVAKAAVPGNPTAH